MDESRSSLAQELEAMAAVGQVLSGLTDPAARLRVLKWAAERFDAVESGPVPEILASLSASAAAPAPVPVAADPGLAVDSLNDMFVVAPIDDDDDLGVFDADSAAAESVKHLPLEVVVRSFAEEFHRFAEEWNRATA